MPALLRLKKKHVHPSTNSPPQPTEATSTSTNKGRGLSKLKLLGRTVARSDVKDIIVDSDQDEIDEEEKVVAELAYADEDLTLTATLSTLSTVTDDSTISASSTLSSIGSNLSASDLTPSTTVDSALSAGDSTTPLTASAPVSAAKPTLKQRLRTKTIIIQQDLLTLKHRIVFSPTYNRARIFCAPGRRLRIKITDFLSLSIKTTLKFVFETLPWNIYFYTGKVVFGLGIILAIVAFIVGVKMGKI